MAVLLPRGTGAGRGPERSPRRPRAPVPALLAVAVVLVAAAAAYGVAALVDPRYGARAELLYEVGDVVASEPRAERLLATQVVMLRSRAVLGPVAAQAGIRAEALAERVEVELLQDSQVIQLTVSDTDRERALEVAGQIVERYAQAGQPASGAAVAGQVEFLRGQIEELSAQQAAVEEGLAELAADRDADQPPGAGERRLELERDMLLRSVAERESRLLALELEGATDVRARVLSAPYLLADPLWPRPLQALAVGVLAGLALAAGLLLVAYRFGRPARP